jgi:hypothetical protein
MVWLVHHRDGECATKINAPFPEGAANVETLCGNFVTLPVGMSRGKPDCAECNSLLYQQRKSAKSATQGTKEGE